MHRQGEGTRPPASSGTLRSRTSSESSPKRRVTPCHQAPMRRRSPIEPVIGHIKPEHRMGRNYLAGEHGDAVNAMHGCCRLQLLAPTQLVQAAFVPAHRRAQLPDKTGRSLIRFIVHGRLNSPALLGSASSHSDWNFGGDRQLFPARTFGCRSLHGLASSRSRATRTSVASSPKRPTI